MALHARALPPVRAVLTALALIAALGACAEDAATPPHELSMWVTAHPSPPVTGREVTWVIEVTNEASETVALRFHSSQRGDVRLSSQRAEVYHWAEDAAFAQQLSEVRVPPGETTSFELEDLELEVAPGRYDLLGVFHGHPAPAPIRRPIVVEPGVP